MTKAVLEHAAQELAAATAGPPFLYDLGPQGARRVLDDLQAAPAEKSGAAQRRITRWVPAL
ncbi:hypothetical protein [Streptomyces sp. NPDC005181]|uniref:hypothetical protein n=1 Tax=Streptomyces sp. NPDC005181 TaxID=3156869 RepID=UPI0033BA6B24